KLAHGVIHGGDLDRGLPQPWIRPDDRGTYRHDRPTLARPNRSIDNESRGGHTRTTRMLTRYSDARLPTPHGEFRVVVYRTGAGGGAGASVVGAEHEEHVA